MNSPPEGPKKVNKFNPKKAKRLYSNNLASRSTKKSDSLKPKTLGKLSRNKKTKENVKKALKPHTKNPPRCASKKEQGKTKSMAKVFDSKTRKSTRWDSGTSNNSSHWDRGAKSNSSSNWDQEDKSNSSSHWDQGSKSNSNSHWDQRSKSNSSSRWDQGAKSSAGYHKPKSNRWQQEREPYPDNSWQSQPGYNGYNWGYYGYSNNGYDMHWGYDKPENPLYHLYQNHVKSNQWKSSSSSTNGSHSQNANSSFHHSAASSGYGPQRLNGHGSFHQSANSKPNGHGSLHQSASSKPNGHGSFHQSANSKPNGHGSFHQSANSKPKRPLQTIEDAKREKEEAAKVAQEMKNQEEIAAKASKLKAALNAKKNEGNQVKFTFSTGHWSPSNKEQERERPQQELNDFNLTPGDLAQIGRGANVANTLVEDEPPPVLPVYVNCLAAVPVTTEGEVQERPRVAYNPALAKPRASPSTSDGEGRPRVAFNPALAKPRLSPSASDGEDRPAHPQDRPSHPTVAKGRTAVRSRTVSESNKRGGVAAKRIRKASEQNKRSLELPETRAEKDVYDIGKFKQALLKMNKRELSELVNSPTSNKSKLLMSALVRDHRRLIAQRLNQVRFNCTSKMFVSMGENLDNANSLLEVELPPELLVHISDIIKMEVPDVEIIAERLSRKDPYAIPAIKEEQPEEHADHREIKKEIGDKDRAEADEIIEVPVPPKPTPPVVDLETPEETKEDNAMELDFIIADGMEIAEPETEDNVSQKNKSTTKKKTKNAGDAIDSCKGKRKMDAMTSKESDEIVPFEGLRREPRKRGRPKNGEIRRNLGQEIIIGTIDSSGNESSNDSEASPSRNKKSKVQEEEPTEEVNGHVEQVEVPTTSDEGANEKNLRLIFEEESKLWREFKANREELEKLQAKEVDILKQMQFCNELKRQMFKF